MQLSNARVFATLPVVDLNTARKFYEDTLGFKRSDMVTASTEDTIYCAGGNTEFSLYTRPTPTKADHTALSITVDNLDETLRDLRSKGVKPEEYDLPNVKTTNGISEMGDMRGSWIKDPAGNIIALVEVTGAQRDKMQSMLGTTTTTTGTTSTTGTTRTY